MIQRIQSIFLFAAAALMLVAAFFLTIWSADVDGCTYLINSINATSSCSDGSEFVGYILILEVIFAVLCLYSVFNFKKRKLQLMVGAINSLLGSGCLVCIVLFTRDWVKAYTGTYDLGFYFPLVAIFLNILANRFIRKDEKMVRSLDRIR